MMILLYAYLVFIGATIALQVMYLSVMALETANDAGRIPSNMVRLFRGWAVFCLACDMLYNLTVGTVFFLKYPQDWTLSYRLMRYKRQGGWRGKMAAYICRNLLDPFDPSGCHCKS